MKKVMALSSIHESESLEMPYPSLMEVKQIP